MAVTYGVSGDDVKVSIYLDGALVKECANSEGFTPSVINALGARTSYVAGGALSGSLDDAMVYNRELSAAKVLKIYEAQAT